MKIKVKDILKKLFAIFSNRIKLLRNFPYICSISSDDIYFAEKLYKFLKIIYFLEYKKRNKYKYIFDERITNNLLKEGYSFSSANIYKLFRESNLREQFYNINWDAENINKRKSWMWYYIPEINASMVSLINSLALELSGYLDGLPVLRSLYFWRSNSCKTNQNYKGSQLFHMDNNDWRQIRVFYAIDDINLENGSPEFISSKKSRKIYKHFKISEESNSRNIKREDIYFERFNKEIKTKSLEAGQILYLDTGNCYHRGSRKLLKDRNVFVAQFMTPFHIHTKLVNRSQDYLIPDFIRGDFLSRNVFKYFFNSMPQKGYE